MFAPAVLVFEKQQRRLEAALKRQLGGKRVVRPCKTPADLRSQLQSRPGSVVVVDLATAGDAGTILQSCLDSPRAGALIVISPPLSDQDEWTLREIGATSVLVEPVAEQDLARTVGQAFQPDAAIPRVQIGDSKAWEGMCQPGKADLR